MMPKTAFLILTSIGLVAFTWVSASHNDPIQAFLGFALLIVPLGVLLSLVYDPESGPIGIGFWTLNWVWISFASWVQISTKSFPWFDSNTNAFTAPTQLLTLLSYFSFWLGYKKLAWHCLPRVRKYPKEVPGRRLRGCYSPRHCPLLLS